MTDYLRDNPVYWWHDSQEKYYRFANDWEDMLDGGIQMSQKIGTGVNSNSWTGSDRYGSLNNNYVCSNWQSASPSESSFVGNASFSTSSWLTATLMGCDELMALRCISMCRVESNCSNGTK